MTFFTFAKGRKDDCTTAPGMYDIPSCFGKGPKYTFRSRPKDKNPDFCPKYNELPSTLSKNGVKLAPKNQCFQNRGKKEEAQPELQNISGSIGNGPKIAIHSRPSTPMTTNPGPGDYDPEKPSFTHSCSMGVGKRFNFIEDNIIVPPGAYDIPSTIEVKKVGRGAAKKKNTREKFQKKQHPGPIYNVQSTIGSDARRSAFPKGPRDMPINSNPGPGEYDIPSIFDDTRKIRTTFHSRTREKPSDTNNAPFYNIPSTIQPKKKSMSSRPATSYETPSPGPKYDIPSTIKPKKKTIGIRNEIKDPMAEIPGPDSYFRSNPLADVNTDVVCPFDAPYERDIIDYKEASSLPGPSDYNTARSTLSSKGFTIKNKPKDDNEPDTAAPYRMLSSTLGGPAYTIGDRDA